jgi:DNA adenine methylase
VLVECIFEFPSNHLSYDSGIGTHLTLVPIKLYYSLEMIKAPHAFPYQGSKRNLARAILPYLPDDINCFIEPFAGSAAMSIAALINKKAKTLTIGDLNKPLIELWCAIVNSPGILSDQYHHLWTAQFESDEGTYYEKIRNSFNQDFKPEHFLYLLARCVKAAVRYNSHGKFNQSRDKRRLGMKPQNMRENIHEVSSLLFGKTQFFSCDYKETLQRAKSNDLVYMDPPYQGTSKKHDTRYLEGLDYDEFVSSLEVLNSNSIPFLVSYDGRTGDKQHGRLLPDHLCLEHIELHAGRSAQATLLGRDAETYESLYLSAPLIEKISHKKRLQVQPVQPLLLSV